MYCVTAGYHTGQRPPVLVVSHERSGTHFLINTLASCYGYVNHSYINLDRCGWDMNYSYPPHLREFLLSRVARHMDRIVKSHHQAEFFGDELPRITERYTLFYIYRDPVAVLLSCWRFMHRWHWPEGPKVADPLTYARAEPCGHMMWYQLRQYPNMMARWAAHVEGWRAAAAAVPAVVLVRYEDLDARFEETARGWSRNLGVAPGVITRPSRAENVILGGPEDPAGLGIPPDIAALRSLCQQTVGETMTQLGYFEGKGGSSHKSFSPSASASRFHPSASATPSHAK